MRLPIDQLCGLPSSLAASGYQSVAVGIPELLWLASKSTTSVSLILSVSNFSGSRLLRGESIVTTTEWIDLDRDRLSSWRRHFYTFPSLHNNIKEDKSPESNCRKCEKHTVPLRQARPRVGVHAAKCGSFTLTRGLRIDPAVGRSIANELSGQPGDISESRGLLVDFHSPARLRARRLVSAIAKCCGGLWTARRFGFSPTCSQR